ncbi:MAG: hypothetical protein HFG20_02055 [Anaerotruncus sp.]|jgi:hypothetical protein|nr:hypothetical protein [Anaerotruncus sp.]
MKKDWNDSFFRGNPFRSGLSQQQPTVQQYPLPEMIKTLAALTQEQWGLYAFSREPLRGRIDRQARLELTAQAVACGQQQARALRSSYGGLSPAGCAEKLGLEVRREPQANDGGFVIFAQFKPPRQLTLFTDCLKQAQTLLGQYHGLPIRSVQEIENLLLAHELFHYLEQQEATLFTRAYRLPLWKLGPFHSSSRVGCLSEIAGMAFAAAFCGTAYVPYLLDVFLVYGYQPDAACNLYEGILRVTQAPNEEEG